MHVEELVEVLDDDGSVADIVPRHRMRSQRLPHRATFVIQLMVEPAGKAPLRSPSVDEVERLFAELDWVAVLGRSGGLQWLAEPAPTAASNLAISASTTVVVHQRADWKDVYPGYWDLAFGGVCGVAEPWLASARRELAEEAGIDDAVVFPVGAGRHVDDTGSVFGAVFLALSTRFPQPEDGEVVAVDIVEIGRLEAWMEGRPVCPDSKAMVTTVLDRLHG